MNNSLDYHVEQSLKISGGKGKNNEKSGCGDWDLAWVLYQMCKHSYVCTSVKTNMWMAYKNHRWPPQSPPDPQTPHRNFSTEPL